MRCDAFAEQVFEFVTVRVAALLSARPGGHPMKPLKRLERRPFLKESGKLELGKGPEGALEGGFLEGIAYPMDPHTF